MARKILLADDSVTAQNMGRKILADAGYDVTTVNNGSAALKRIAEIKPDLIVLDVYMPGYSGLEVCQRLKDSEETAHIPVLLTVGKLEPFKPEEARRVRADAHIVKPFEASELLTAITRLEDRMVPQSEGRFSTSVSGLERFEGSGRKTEGTGEADTGWKSRLRFPSKKKKEEKEEPEPEDVSGTAPFRDFRKGKGKIGAGSAFTVKAPPPPGQEPGLVPDIPRDITPEELDALSALVAKLDGPIPAAENITSLADEAEIATEVGLVEAPAVEVVAAQTEGATEAQAPAAVAAREEHEKEEAETPTPVVEPSVAAVAAPVPAVEAPAAVIEEKIEGKSEVKIPVEQIEPAGEGAALVPNPPAVTAVNTALLAQDPAPVDKTDEPMFASASAVEKVAEEKVEATLAEAVAVKNLEPKPEESRLEEPKAQESKTEELKAENTAQPVPVAASVPEPVEAEEPAPSDAELAEALRLLTPATGYTDSSSSSSQNTIPSHGTLVAAGQLLAEEAARNAAAGPRWIAEPVALSPEEAGISLEAEMFRTLATMPASVSVPAGISGGQPEAGRITGVSAIAAAVENRLAEAGLASAAPSLAEHGANSESAAAQTSVAEAPVEVAPVLNAASSLEREAAPEPIATLPIEVQKSDVEQKESPAQVAEEAPAKEIAAATFADAVGKNEINAAAEQIGESVSETTVAVQETNQNSSSDSGGEEAMGKSGKWNQIRTAPTGVAAGTNVVEAAKQGLEEAPKAMAAAAAADGSASTSTTDASTIASIVDSVMADLRPKIVEEIAKKLAGK